MFGYAFVSGCGLELSDDPYLCLSFSLLSLSLYIYIYIFVSYTGDVFIKESRLELHQPRTKLTIKEMFFGLAIYVFFINNTFIGSRTHTYMFIYAYTYMHMYEDH